MRVYSRELPECQLSVVQNSLFQTSYVFFARGLYSYNFDVKDLQIIVCCVSVFLRNLMIIKLTEELYFIYYKVNSSKNPNY